MKTIASTILAALALSAMVVFGGEIDTFVQTLNTKWIARDHNGIRQAIDDRLAQKTNDLAALVAETDYYTSIETNFPLAQTLTVQIKSVRDSLVWTNDLTARLILDAMIDSVENKQNAENAGYIFGLSANQIEQVHAASPTNYPICIFLPRLANVQYGSQ